MKCEELAAIMERAKAAPSLGYAFTHYKTDVDALLDWTHSLECKAEILHDQLQAALLQNGDMKKTLMWIRQNHPHVWFPPSTPSDKCSVCIAIDNALALKPLPVEGQPGEVCGPCGVAHPVVEKPVDETPKESRPIGDELRELAAKVPPEAWRALDQKRHPFTCGECRAEIRTDVCPKCAEKRKGETDVDGR